MRWNRSTLHRFVLCTTAGFAIMILMCAGYVAQPRLLRHLDLKVYDLLLEGHREGTPSPLPVLVDIDEKSLARVGQWPWPRSILAELLAVVAESGAAAVGVDILTPEPDRTSLGPLLRSMERTYGIAPRLSGVPEELMDNDRILADVLKQIPAVLSSYLDFASSDIPNGPPEVRSLAIVGHADGLMGTAPGVVMPLPILAAAAPHVGFMNSGPDEDGVMRRVPLMIAWNGVAQPIMSLRALAVAMGNRTIRVSPGPDGGEEIRVGDLKIPLYGGCRLPLAFRGGRGMYPSFSASDVLEGTVPPENFAGRIVFVGSTAAGLMDIRATPFERSYPGLEIHAAIVDTILSGRFISVPSWTPGAQVMLIVATGIVATLLFTFSGPLLFLSASALSMATVCAASWNFFRSGLFLSPLYALLTIAAEGTFLLMLRFRLESRERRVLRAAFSNYVAPEVVRRIAGGEPVELRGEQREISVLFTDIRSFTSISERLSPPQLVSLLNRYFAPMTALVRRSTGTVDKFVGDAMVAFWNAPLDVPDHPKKALFALMEMKRALADLNETFEREFGFRLSSGAGLHCGVAHVGNMGTADLMNYTAVGDTVNLASRLEGMCPIYGVDMVLSRDIIKKCDSVFYWKKIDSVRAKGRTEPVEIYTPVRDEDVRACGKELELWSDAQALYAGGRFHEAGRLLEELRILAPGVKLYEIFALRCVKFAAAPPPDWDGVYTHESK